VLSNLCYSPDINYKKFENALADTGRLMGFGVQEPEAEFGNGPDVLWIMNDNHYLVLEAKSMAVHDEITRDNIGQLLQSGEWLKKNYGQEVAHNLVTVQAPNKKGTNVNISPETRVLDVDGLDLLKKNLRHFIDGVINSGFSACQNKICQNY
jgi:hypothetical protein